MLSGQALADRRVKTIVRDVSRVISAAPADSYDAIVLDLYEGPHQATNKARDPLYGREALERAFTVLRARGVLAIWSEEPDRAFESRMEAAGFEVQRHPGGRGGRAHTIYLGIPALPFSAPAAPTLTGGGGACRGCRPGFAVRMTLMGAQWKQKGRVAAADAKGRIFTKLAKEIMVAARHGADPGMNPRLRMAIEAAKKASMTKDTLERAIKKGAGLLDENVTYETVVYEGFAPHQVPVIVECLTDNKNRTATNMRVLFRKGQLGNTGSVSWDFTRLGIIEATPAGASTARRRPSKPAPRTSNRPTRARSASTPTTAMSTP